MVAPRIQIYVDESIHDSLGFIVSAFVFSKDRLDGRVVEADFRSIGIAAGKSFQLRCRDNTFNVLLGRGFGDVPLGEWVAFLSAQGARYLADNLELDAPKRAMPPNKSAAAWASGLLRLPGLPTLVDVITM